MWRFHPKPVIYGIEALSLNPSEKQFFATARPFGFILFSRNIESAEQISALVRELAEYAPGEQALVFIDQEGGRVARIGSAIMESYPAARLFGKLYERDPQVGERATYLAGRSLAGELRNLGINANCAPVCDVLSAETHEVIGDRSFASDADVVCHLAAAQARGFADAGVFAVIKHIPGHGRANVDSHKDLPRVKASAAELRKSDFVPFRHLREQSFAMTAHILYEALDGEHAATLSKSLIDDVIRGDIGFGGLLMSDDLSMGALGEALRGDYGERARGALAAGCDLVLHCNGRMAEMREIDAVLSDMQEQALDFFANRYKLLSAVGDYRLWRQEWLDYRKLYREFEDC